MRAPYLLLLAAVLAAGCQPRTELMFGVVTDIRAPGVLDGVQLQVTRVKDGFVEAQVPWSISGIPDQPFNLPGSYGVFSEGGEIQLSVEVVGLKDGHPVVTRRAIVSTVHAKTLFVRLGLTVGCMNRSDCTVTQSCVEGVCRDVHIDARQLPDYQPALVDHLTCDSGVAYLQTATGLPMSFSTDAALCPANLCFEGTCLKPVP